ncbi:MAG TPA: hypothetical protein VJ851_00605 [Jatrophihabitans sp.]|nr:hypothetical protein [Jatrophihabitans sp.]
MPTVTEFAAITITYQIPFVCHLFVSGTLYSVFHTDLMEAVRMRIEVKAATAIAAALVAAGVAVGVIATGGNHPQQPAQLVVHQDAAVASTSTSHAAPAKPAAVSRPTATVVAKHTAAIQEAPVTNPSDAANPVDSTPTAQPTTEPGATKGPDGGPLPTLAPPEPVRTTDAGNPVLPSATPDRTPDPAPSSSS